MWVDSPAQVLSKADTERFVAAAHLLLAPGGVFFGSTGGAEDAGALPRCSLSRETNQSTGAPATHTCMFTCCLPWWRIFGWTFGAKKAALLSDTLGPCENFY